MTRSKSSIKAVIFDIDGTIIDTSEYITQAFEFVLKKHSLPSRTREEIASQIGKKLEECYAFLAHGYDYKALKKDHDDFQTANLALIKAFDNVENVLKQIHQKGIRLGLWTGRNHKVIESIEKAGLELDIFDCIIEPDEVKQGKPHPEGLHKALKILKTPAKNAAMIGDSPLDIEAGKAAGVAVVVGLTHGFGTREELKKARADYIVDSFAELTKIL